MTNSPSSMFSQLNLKNSSLNKTIKLILFKNIENYLYYLYWDLIYSLPEINQQIDFINNNVLHLLDIFAPEIEVTSTENIFLPLFKTFTILKIIINLYGDDQRIPKI